LILQRNENGFCDEYNEGFDWRVSGSRPTITLRTFMLQSMDGVPHPPADCPLAGFFPLLTSTAGCENSPWTGFSILLTACEI
jgi:hypothetical protein